MKRSALVLFLLLSCATVGYSQTSAQQLFADANHDFGIVPRGSQLLHRFSWTNTEKSALEVSDVKASCGCATVNALPRVVPPGQSGVIEVHVDARKFVGDKAVNVNLLIGPGVLRAVTLQIKAHSRPDIVYNPGFANFGTLGVGGTGTQTVEIEYAGQLDWKLGELQNPSPHIEARVEEMYRKPGATGYKVHVTLKPSAPAGDFKYALQFKTNDTQTPLVPLLVEAVIRPAVTVMPNPVTFGSLRVGQKVSRKVVVRGEKPFRILDLKVQGDYVTASAATNGSMTVHQITITCEPKQPGDFSAQLLIKTDVEAQPEVSVQVQGEALQ